MSIGLPGSGIGGVFYLASAVAMPFSSVRRSRRGGSPRRMVVLRQTTLAVLIIGALWLTGFGIDWMLAGGDSSSSLRAAAGSGVESGVPRMLRVASFAVTFGTLAFVLLLVQVLRIFVRPPSAERRELQTPAKAA